jgi:DNA-binding NarL/FixJ family response regulator
MFLVIDSEKDRGHAIANALEKSFPSTSVFVAEYGELGVELAKKFHPEVVMSAISVHGKTGIQVFQEIHSQFPELEFVLTSGMFARNQAKYVGIKYFFSDMYPIKKLIEIVKKIKGGTACPTT